MNYIKKSLGLLTIIFALNNAIQAAGAKVFNSFDAPIYFELLTTNGRKGRIIEAGKTEEIDGGALVGIDGARYLYCGKVYQVIFTEIGKTRIEGIEGWRSWEVFKDGINIGSSGLLLMFGMCRASVVVEGKCPCVIPSL